MDKHAYLIMAHDDLPLLKVLVRLLDNPSNDIYVHIDKKYAGGVQTGTYWCSTLFKNLFHSAFGC